MKKKTQGKAREEIKAKLDAILSTINDMRSRLVKENETHLLSESNNSYFGECERLYWRCNDVTTSLFTLNRYEELFNVWINSKQKLSNIKINSNIKTVKKAIYELEAYSIVISRAL